MEKKKIGEAKKQVDSPFVFYLVLVLLIASLLLLLVGLKDIKKKLLPLPVEDSRKIDSTEETSLSEFFEASSEYELEGQDFLKTDPFLKTCGEVSGDSLPSVISNTVCLR